MFLILSAEFQSALKLVLDLADSAILTEEAVALDEKLEAERSRQMDAVDLVEKFLELHEGTGK